MVGADAFNIIDQAIRSLDARLRALANQQPALQAWVAPTLINAWANTGAPYQLAGYWKDPYGTVHLRGRVDTGVTPSDIFVLPAGYRPEATSSFLLPSTATVDVEADGSVRGVTGATFISLDSITFRAFA